MNTGTHVDTPAQQLERDRPMIEQRLDDVAWLCRHGSYHSACQAFGEVRRAIEQYLEAEQRVVERLERQGFCPPALAAGAALSRDHLRALAENVWVTISGSDGDDYDKPIAALRRGLTAHARADLQLGSWSTRNVIGQA